MTISDLLLFVSSNIFKIKKDDVDHHHQEQINNALSKIKPSLIAWIMRLPILVINLILLLTSYSYLPHQKFHQGNHHQQLQFHSKIN